MDILSQLNEGLMDLGVASFYAIRTIKFDK